MPDILKKCPGCGEPAGFVLRREEESDRFECRACRHQWTLKGCLLEDGRGGVCELVKDHVGSPHRSPTWEWDCGEGAVSRPRREDVDGIVWPVFREHFTPGCQLCRTGAPVFRLDTANGHIVSWAPGTSAWIPCSAEDRRKADEIDARLKAYQAQAGEIDARLKARQGQESVKS